MTPNEAIDRFERLARGIHEQDVRRLVTDSLVDDMHPDDVDDLEAFARESFEVWLRGVIARVRSELRA